MPLHILALLTNVTGAFMWLAVVFGVAASVRLRPNEAALSELFAFPPLGGLFSKPYLMRIKFFLPWVSIRSSLGLSAGTKALVWAARLSGTVFLLGFLGIFATVAYMVLHKA